MNWQDLTLKKRRLDALRPLDTGLVQALGAWLRLDWVHASGALAGSSLTRDETAKVVDDGLGIGGKGLQELLQAVNQAIAFDQMMDWSRSKSTLDEQAVLQLHSLLLRGVVDTRAEGYRRVPVRRGASRNSLPPPARVPKLMADWGRALALGPGSQHPAEWAADAHLQLAIIHPFLEGNGRCGRLLMNLTLLKAGYPLALIRPRDKFKYQQALEKVQMDGPRTAYDQLVYAAIDRGLDVWLDAAAGKLPLSLQAKKAARAPATALWRIGRLGKESGESVATLRYWTKLGLLTLSGTTEKGYSLYGSEALDQARQIRALQRQRMSLSEVAVRLGTKRS